MLSHVIHRVQEFVIFVRYTSVQIKLQRIPSSTRATAFCNFVRWILMLISFITKNILLATKSPLFCNFLVGYKNYMLSHVIHRAQEFVIFVSYTSVQIKLQRIPNSTRATAFCNFVRWVLMLISFITKNILLATKSPLFCNFLVGYKNYTLSHAIHRV